MCILNILNPQNTKIHTQKNVKMDRMETARATKSGRQLKGYGEDFNSTPVELLVEQASRRSIKIQLTRTGLSVNYSNWHLQISASVLDRIILKLTSTCQVSPQ